jgi:inner membrane protein involved in colicin E2 resistance
MANSNASEPAGAGWRATVLSVLLVAAVVAIPLFLLRSLVHERIELKGRAQANADESWGGPQTIDGPALEIPLTAAGISAGRIVLLPQSLDASAEISIERRSRGLFQALIYESKIMLTGRFAAPELGGARNQPSHARFQSSQPGGWRKRQSRHPTGGADARWQAAGVYAYR